MVNNPCVDHCLLKSALSGYFGLVERREEGEHVVKRVTADLLPALQHSILAHSLLTWLHHRAIHRQHLLQRQDELTSSNNITSTVASDHHHHQQQHQRVLLSAPQQYLLLFNSDDGPARFSQLSTAGKRGLARALSRKATVSVAQLVAFLQQEPSFIEVLSLMVLQPHFDRGEVATSAGRHKEKHLLELLLTHHAPLLWSQDLPLISALCHFEEAARLAYFDYLKLLFACYSQDASSSFQPLHQRLLALASFSPFLQLQAQLIFL